MPSSDADISRHQHMPRYYAQRAKEYERVFDKPHRQPDLARLKQWLSEQFSGRHVLEIATGTGYWLPAATAQALSWLGTDINPEVLNEARSKALDFNKVTFRLADAYTPGLVAAGEASPFDAGFAGLWFSHVPMSRKREWLQGLHSQLQPGARVVLIENRYVEGDSTPVHRLDAEGNGYQLRGLSDGSQHEVLKNFPTEARMQELLTGLGQDLDWRELDYFWTLSYRTV